MFAISPVDAISSAIQRTRTFLFRPFRFGTYLKLCLVALLTEGFNLQFSGPGSKHHSNLFSVPTLTPGRVALAVAAGIGVILLVCFLYYLITRLRFAYFHCLVHNTKEIRPGWRMYRTQAIRFFWLSLAVGLCFLLFAAVVALPFAVGFWRLFRNAPAGGHPNIGSMLALALPLLPILLLLIALAIAADLILRDFMLPHFALENAPTVEAWKSVWARIKAEKGSFFIYALLRVFLPIAALIGLFIVLIIPGILLLATVAAAEVGIHFAFSNVLGIFLSVLVGVIAVGMALLAGICLGGPLSTAIREYALLFYGSRYQPLGDILSPPDIGLNVPGIA